MGKQRQVPGLNRDEARDRINALLAEKPDHEQDEIKKATGIDPKQIINVLGAAKSDISMEFMAIFAQVLNMPMDYILYGKTEPMVALDERYIKIPYIENETNENNGLIFKPSSNCAARYNALLQITANPEGLVMIKAKSDCMESTISKNDEILIDASDRAITDGGIYAFNTFSFKYIQIKRFFIHINEIGVMSDNKKYDTYLANIKDVNIIGKVVLCKHFLL